MQAADAPQTSHRPQVVVDPLFSAPAHSLPREGAPLAGKGAAARAVPDGNHGDNVRSDHHGQLSLFLESAAEEAFNLRVSHERTAEAAHQREALIVSLYATHSGLSVEQVYDMLSARGGVECAE